MDLKRYLSAAELALTQPSVGDEFDISINEVFNLETEVLESKEDGITLAMDDRGMAILEELGVIEDQVDEILPVLGALAGRAVGSVAGAAGKAAGSIAGSMLGKAAANKLDKNKLTDAAGESYDQSYGSPYDRGASDAYYGRGPRPHKIVPVVGGVQGQQELMPLTDPAEIAAYNAGYEEAAAADDRKDYGESAATEGAAVSYKVLVVDPETYDKQTLEISAVTSSEAKEKAEAKGYKVLKVTDTLEDSKDLNHLLKLSGLAERKAVKAEREKEKNEKVDEAGNTDVIEAEYQGRDVKLGKPMSGDVKKYKVYVRDPKSGNVKKVNFGDKNMEIKRDNPERRKNFRARHNCSDKKDRTKSGYWSCRMWSKKPVSKIV